MEKGITELVFILDRSGSMGGLESDTIGGFNSMMEKQKKEDGEALVSTILFDDKYELLYDRLPIGTVPKMTENEYYVRGCTALLDAIGESIQHIKKIHKYARKEDRPEKTLFVITTDGMENASTRYDYEEIKKMVEHQREKYGWEFLFIGANIDAIEEAQRFGIRKERAVNYVHDEEGTSSVYASVSKAVQAARMADPVMYEMAIGESDWAADIKADYKRRKKK